jgi:hypothetical protein
MEQSLMGRCGSFNMAIEIGRIHALHGNRSALDHDHVFLMRPSLSQWHGSTGNDNNCSVIFAMNTHRDSVKL